MVLSHVFFQDSSNNQQGEEAKQRYDVFINLEASC